MMTHEGVIALNRLVGSTSREPGITDADAGSLRHFVFSEIPGAFSKNIFF
jgi:hypothetical protein